MGISKLKSLKKAELIHLIRQKEFDYNILKERFNSLENYWRSYYQHKDWRDENRKSNKGSKKKS